MEERDFISADCSTKTGDQISRNATIGSIPKRTSIDDPNLSIEGNIELDQKEMIRV